MASVLRRKSGGVAIQFLDRSGKRRTLSLGGDPPERFVKRAAEVVDDLVGAARYGQPIPPDAVAWLDGLNDEQHGRFVTAGLAHPREKRDAARVTVAQHAAEYLGKRTDIKPGSRLVVGQVVRVLGEYFGETPLADVTAGDADDFARWLSTGGRTAEQVKTKGAALSPATVGKRISWSATIWRDAVRRGLVDRNPFDEVRRPCTVNQERRQYVPRETIETLIVAEPDPEWRALLALARYLGLRTPSEPFSLVWSDIDWERRRIKIRSPKTEGHGKAFRVAPLLPEVARHLEALFAVAPEGLYVFSRLRERASRRKAEKGFWSALNLRTFLLKKLEKAGIPAWPKLWHNLRASAQTDLTARFPAHSVAQWMGNTVQVANKHYLMTTDAEFDRAATESALQSALHSGAEMQRMERSAAPGKAKTPEKSGVLASIGDPSGI
jgi:integrase